MAVTSISIIVGGPEVHVTVCDQNDNPLPPADITWSGLPTGVTEAADATGFNFTADGSAVAGSTPATATYAGPNAVGTPTGELTLDVMIGVTSLTFTSP